MKREYLYLSGFLKEDSEDDSLKYEFEVPPEHQAAILAIMGWRTLDDSQGNGWELSSEQVAKISTVIGRQLPTFLILYIETLISG